MVACAGLVEVPANLSVDISLCSLNSNGADGKEVTA